MFDLQAAKQAGYSDQEIQSYLSQHPEVQPSQDSQPSGQSLNSGISPDSSGTQQNIPNSVVPNTNPTAAPGVGSLGQIGELTGSLVGFENAGLSQSTDEQRGELALATQRLIQAASRQNDPVKRARLLQVAHDNVDAMNALAGTANKIREQGMNATPDIKVPFGGGTVSPATSPQQAAGIALKTGSLAPSLPLAAAGAGFGAGQTLEENGPNASPGDVALHAGTNALGAELLGRTPQILGKALPNVLSKTSEVPAAALEQAAQNPTRNIFSPASVGETLNNTQDVIKTGFKNLSSEAGQQLKSLDIQFKPQNLLTSENVGTITNLANKYPTLREALPQNLQAVKPSEGLGLLQAINKVIFGTGEISKADANQIESLRQNVKSWVINNFGGENGPAQQYLENYTNKINVLQAADDLYKAFETKGKGSADAQAKALQNMMHTFEDDGGTYLKVLKELADQTGHSEIVDKAASLHYQKILPEAGTMLGNLKKMSLNPFHDVANIVKILSAPLSFPFRSPRGAAGISELGGLLGKAVQKGLELRQGLK